MQDDLNQKISQFLDNELNFDEAMILLEDMNRKPELKEQMMRYEAIGNTLRNETFILANPDFASRISQQIKQEPAYLLPKTQRVHRPKPIDKASYKLFALAASVAFVTVLSLRQDKLPETPAVFQSAGLQVAKQEPVQLPPKAEKSNVNQRFNDYLQAHNNSVYTNGEAQFQPYARVAAFERE